MSPDAKVAHLDPILAKDDDIFGRSYSTRYIAA